MPPFTLLALPELFLVEVIGHARGELPNECCGLLAGEIRDGVGVVSARFPLRNDEASPTRFRSNAEDMLAAFRMMRSMRLELLAIYHSHPTTGPLPSRRDVEENNHGNSVVHLIVGFAESTPEVRGWWLPDGRMRPAAVSVVGKSRHR